MLFMTIIPAEQTQAATPVKVQPTLTVGAADDLLEREADDIADRVMRMPDPAWQVLGRCPGGCPSAPMSGEREGITQLGHGTPLDAASRGFFEPRFGYDFGEVRIHSGRSAAQAAASIRARAFTIGRDVVFGEGEQNPISGDGRRLLAHELVHVVQQSFWDSVRSREHRGPRPDVSEGFSLRPASPGIVRRLGPESEREQPEPAFELLGNEPGAAGARLAAASLTDLVTGKAVARALATIPITDAVQKNIVIQQVLNSPAALRRLAEHGRVRRLSQEEYERGVETLGFPSGADAFADAANDFFYITPHGTPSAFTMGHEVSHIQTGAVRGSGTDPDVSGALGNLNTEVRAAFVDYAILKLATLRDDLAADKSEDQAVAGFAEDYSRRIFDYIATHGSVQKTLTDLASAVSAQKGAESVPRNMEELKKAVRKGFVSEADLALIFSPAARLIEEWTEPFEMESP